MRPSIASSTRVCPCHGVGSSHRPHSDVPVLCAVCVSHDLQKPLERHSRTLQARNEARDQCARRLEELRRGQSISELAYESQQLRDRLATLRHQCGSLAVKVASRVVENDERRAQHEDPTPAQQQLTRLHDSLCDPDVGALSRSISSSTEQVKRLRFQWAIQVFAMHRLDVDQDEKNSRPTMRHRHARGIGKIGGLPLPHAGPELYGVLPPHELQSALRLVASLTSTVARCLGIVLPHPIRLQPDGPNGDITDTVTQRTIVQNPGIDRKEPSVASSTTSLLSIMETTSSWGRKALARATGQQALKETAHASIPPSMDSIAVTRRLHHACSAVLAEDHSPSTSLYALSHSATTQDEFAIGLQLLQNDIVALCIRAGVPVATLWPAEAVLLNLYALWMYCGEQVGAL
jgi:Vacuolar sorting 38 and autophagy-related subunit 14